MIYRFPSKCLLAKTCTYCLNWVVFPNVLNTPRSGPLKISQLLLQKCECLVVLKSDLTDNICFLHEWEFLRWYCHLIRQLLPHSKYTKFASFKIHSVEPVEDLNFLQTCNTSFLVHPRRSRGKTCTLVSTYLLYVYETRVGSLAPVDFVSAVERLSLAKYYDRC